MVLSVLIVDDSAFMRNMLKNLITQAGAQAIGEAVDGNDAVAKYAELKPNLVFMDIMMPNKTGLEALREIRAADASARVVMCTSIGQDKIVEEAAEAGASDFIVKPFTADDVNTVVSKYNQ